MSMAVGQCLCAMLMTHSTALGQPAPSKALTVTEKNSQDGPIECRQVLLDLVKVYRERTQVHDDVFRYRPSRSQKVAPTNSIAFSPSGRYLIVGEKNTKTIGSPFAGTMRNTNAKEYAMPRLWDLATGREVRRFGGHKGLYIQSGSLTKDDKILATTCFTGYHQRVLVVRVPSEEDVIVWDAQTGEELLHLPIGGVQATLSPDGNWLIVVGSGHVSGYRLSDALREKTPAASWRENIDTNISTQPVISPDSSSVAIAVDQDPRPGARKPAVMILDVQTGASRGQLAFSGDVLAFSADGAKLSVGSDNEMVVCDAANASEIRRFKMNGHVALADLTVDSRQAIAISEQGEFRVWDLETGKSLMEKKFEYGLFKYAISPDRRTIAMASAFDGNSSHRAEGTIRLVDIESGAELFRMHQFHGDRTWITESVDGTCDGSGNLIRLEQLALEEMGLKHDPEKLSQQLSSMRSSVAVSNGHPDHRKGTRMFALPIGISKHKYDEYDLRYAAADAVALEQFIRSQKGTYFSEVVTQLLLNENATRESILEQLDWLKTSCTQNDIAVVLFSGHGITGRNGLYFVTHEGDEEGIQHTCLNWTSVVEKLSEVKAKTIVILADCCHAGAFAQERRPTHADLAALFARRKGLFLYCSSKGNQLSQESPRYGHGAFTYAILQALHGKADSNGDHRVTIAELRQYADAKVAELTDGAQTPFVPFPENFDPQTVLSSATGNLSYER